jgi:uncharacterized delta-60 repeat protein
MTEATGRGAPLGFGGDGIVTTQVSPSSGYDFIDALAIQPGDGKIVAVGYEDQSGGAGTNKDFALARYNPSDGSLDSSFDGDSGTGNGIVTTDFGGSDDEGWGVALQADGKIVAAGLTKDGSATGHTALARYHPDGTLDTNSDPSDPGVDLSADGKVVTAVSTGAGDDDQAYDVAIQPDGKIVAAGGGATNGFGMARYNPDDGTLDTSFGGDGIVTTPLGASSYAFGVAIQPGGKIVLAGLANGSGGIDTGLARFNGSNGTLDTSFGFGGKVKTAIAPGTGTDAANDVALRPDGKIVTAGGADMDSGPGLNNDFALAQYGPVTTVAPPPATTPPATTTPATTANPLCTSLHKKLKKAKTKAKKRKIRHKLRKLGC